MIDPDKLAILTKLREDTRIALERARPHSEAPLGAPDWPDRPMTDAEQAEVRRLEELLASYDAAIQRELQTGETTMGDVKPLVWKGRERALGDVILSAYRDGKLEATSELDALQQAATHFVGQGGKRLNARSLWQSLKNRDDYQDPDKPAPR